MSTPSAVNNFHKIKKNKNIVIILALTQFSCYTLREPEFFSVRVYIFLYLYSACSFSPIKKNIHFILYLKKVKNISTLC